MPPMRRSLVTLALTSALAAAPLAAQASAPPDVIFTGAFVTLDSAAPRAEAMAVRDGRIVAIGSRVLVERLAGPRTRRIALPGAALPGFVDAHVHAAMLGELLESLDLHGSPKAEALARVRRAAAAAPAGQWIVGGGWDQAFWRPSVYPTAAELDAVSAGHPVLLDRVDGHAVWANSRALALAKIGRATRDPAGGRIERAADGTPTGILVDSAVDLVRRVVPRATSAEIRRRLAAALAQYARWGLTGVHDAGDELPVLDALRALGAQGALPIRIYAMASASDSTLVRTLQRGPEVGLFGGMLTIRSLKVVFDGALGSRGALLAAPYADAPTQRGLQLVREATLDSIVRRAVARGLQVNVHAIGDDANHRVFDAFARAGDAARRLRFRVEHASMIPDADVPRFAALGVIASMQPVFVGEYSRFAEARVGAARLPMVYRTRDLLAQGAIVASGTDYPASDAGDPIATLVAAVTRRGPDGKPASGWLPAQAIGLGAALRSMTSSPAYAAFEERDLGALTVGRLADLTVLSADPTRVTRERLGSIRVRRTIVGGRTVFDSDTARKDPMPR
jgi:predicted amidohydrolase YtcJ